MRKERLIRLDLEILLDTMLDEYVNEIDYSIRNGLEVWFNGIKIYAMARLEWYLDKFEIVALENVPFMDRFIIMNEHDIKRFLDGDFVDWGWLEELAMNYLNDLGHSKRKVKKFLNYA
jgi:hypothetical protein